MSEALELLLLALLAGMLVSVVSMIALGLSVPRNTKAHAQLFSPGTVPPYNFVTSLKVRYFVPWLEAPDFAGCRAVAPWSLRIAQAGAIVSAASLVAMGAVGLLTAWV